MEKKFTKKYYKVGINHFQVLISPEMFLEAKLHKDGTYDLLMTNPKFTKPKLGSKMTLVQLMKEKIKTKVNHNYLQSFFSSIIDISTSFVKK